MIASTNHLGEINPVITKRPSRFDRKYHFKVPDYDSRIEYCRYWREKVLDSPAIDFPVELCSVIAGLTDGFSFADIKELFISSLLASAGGNGNGGSSTAVHDSVPEKTQENADKLKRTMPAVILPEGLGDNSFLPVVLAEAKILWDYMENEEADSLKRMKAAAICAPSLPKVGLTLGMATCD
ncbi:hypothetical protein QBC40DRAFT_251704 [Triangularia verruculosa]|uniref:ATPase AAA-type core domain-containing protein n=1 Tax=Triangularia verruculosa TaxID=2587418 RepID=A0AAN6XP26_9PEZI|nr:hypothetical protein QBC40DRAFT_251704 [Triangularia verruculosa]